MVLAVEWGERFREALPSERIDLTLSRDGQGFRRFEVESICWMAPEVALELGVAR